ncbi:hypothetical protein SARC_06556 [Sphaeroforma arctica JP610]|uniref:Dipeptidylpeptidase IV N-terminal domain-containing protein n=1 Tax=Sphaeroforma arctica JP610 TaxID=667725 RepID=A0A0L0FWB6_9EUKA|nr:hypothetical protein SARC_06556 [Sphaeroforma arctica JP610]KNC81107.1 hypothetical protein SARC_06556 [Sphaeroforma arctica JP610]|eukprot:XP_014155009.1 hypothetical protein SARC_06556 [Sphaeroforma arctica JP610]
MHTHLSLLFNMTGFPGSRDNNPYLSHDDDEVASNTSEHTDQSFTSAYEYVDVTKYASDDPTCDITHTNTHDIKCTQCTKLDHIQRMSCNNSLHRDQGGCVKNRCAHVRNNTSDTHTRQRTTPHAIKAITKGTHTRGAPSQLHGPSAKAHDRRTHRVQCMRTQPHPHNPRSRHDHMHAHTAVTGSQEGDNVNDDADAHEMSRGHDHALNCERREIRDINEATYAHTGNMTQPRAMEGLKLFAHNHVHGPTSEAHIHRRAQIPGDSDTAAQTNTHTHAHTHTAMYENDTRVSIYDSTSTSVYDDTQPSVYSGTESIHWTRSNPQILLDDVRKLIRVQRSLQRSLLSTRGVVFSSDSASLYMLGYDGNTREHGVYSVDLSQIPPNTSRALIRSPVFTQRSLLEQTTAQEQPNSHPNAKLMHTMLMSASVLLGDRKGGKASVSGQSPHAKSFAINPFRNEVLVATRSDVYATALPQKSSGAQQTTRAHKHKQVQAYTHTHTHTHTNTRSQTEGTAKASKHKYTHSNILPQSESVRVDVKVCPTHKDLISFVRCGDVWVANTATKEEICISSAYTSGRKGVSAGVAEHVMQEEFDRFTSYWWQPCISTTDSQPIHRILFTVVDESQVAEYPIMKSDGSEQRQRYPCAGSTNASVRLCMADIWECTRTGSVTLQTVSRTLHTPLCTMFAFAEYIVRCGWHVSGRYVWAQLLSRQQERVSLPPQPPMESGHQCVPAGSNGKATVHERTGMSQSAKHSSQGSNTQAQLFANTPTGSTHPPVPMDTQPAPQAQSQASSHSTPAQHVIPTHTHTRTPAAKCARAPFNASPHKPPGARRRQSVGSTQRRREFCCCAGPNTQNNLTTRTHCEVSRRGSYATPEDNHSHPPRATRGGTETGTQRGFVGGTGSKHASESESESECRSGTKSGTGTGSPSLGNGALDTCAATCCRVQDGRMCSTVAAREDDETYVTSRTADTSIYELPTTADTLDTPHPPPTDAQDHVAGVHVVVDTTCMQYYDYDTPRRVVGAIEQGTGRVFHRHHRAQVSAHNGSSQSFAPVQTRAYAQAKPATPIASVRAGVGVGGSEEDMVVDSDGGDEVESAAECGMECDSSMVHTRNGPPVGGHPRVDLESKNSHQSAAGEKVVPANETAGNPDTGGASPCDGRRIKSAGWINITNILEFIEADNRESKVSTPMILWASEHTGHRHLYLVPHTLSSPPHIQVDESHRQSLESSDHYGAETIAPPIKRTYWIPLTQGSWDVEPSKSGESPPRHRIRPETQHPWVCKPCSTIYRYLMRSTGKPLKPRCWRILWRRYQDLQFIQNHSYGNM